MGVTLPFNILLEITALSAKWGWPTALRAIFGEVIARSAIVTKPVLSIVASPPMGTPVATLPALPTKIFPSAKVLAAPANWST